MVLDVREDKQIVANTKISSHDSLTMWCVKIAPVPYIPQIKTKFANQAKKNYVLYFPFE